jgi:FAD/FMN-containing dehydrogenase
VDHPNTIIEALSYEERKARLQQQMRQASEVRLEKKTSNLFRNRVKHKQEALSVRDFNHVLTVNREEGWAEVEGMTTYEHFADETLKSGFMPAVVPQLKTITIGGAVAGVGIEASSFRYGLVHETVMEMEILIASGDVIVCSPKQNTDLFYGFPNSYGTLGYALKLRVKIIPVKPFVQIIHTRYTDWESYFVALKKLCETAREDDGKPDFIDGVVFSPTEMYITTGTFADKAPFTSDYTYMDIYYQSIRQKREDYLSVYDFIWRWDTDWFWCSDAFGAQRPLVRRILGKQRLNSAVYWKIQRFFQSHPFLLWIGNRFSKRENVIQDVDIPIENAPAFATFFFQEINIRPVWICPIGSYNVNTTFDLYPLESKKLYINFGFWSSLPAKKEKGFYNKLVEANVTKLDGKKSLYSDSFYTKDEFWNIYDKGIYDSLKQKYDPQHKLKDLFEKCVDRG